MELDKGSKIPGFWTVGLTSHSGKLYIFIYGTARQNNTNSTERVIMFGCREYKDTDRVYSYIIYNFVDCCNSLFPVLASFRHIMQVDLV